MFEQVLLGKDKERRPWTLALSVTLQAGVVGVLLLIPLIYTEAIPLGALKAAPLPAPAGPPPPLKLVPVPPELRSRPALSDSRLRVPTMIPSKIDMTPSMETDSGPADPTPPGPYVDGGIGRAGPLDPRLTRLLPLAVPQPPPPPPVARPQQRPTTVRRGGEVQEALLVYRPTPVYPHMAKINRISGIVRLEAIISEQGTIEELRALGGHPFLVPAALDAVRQWRYRPTYLNGQPVRVSTTIDVNFTLSH